MNDKSKLIEHFYTEALKHETNSEEFLKNGNQISKFYREEFGMVPFWLDYHKSIEDGDDSAVLRRLEMMKIQLLKLDKS
jgi:hypothetical protein